VNTVIKFDVSDELTVGPVEAANELDVDDPAIEVGDREAGLADEVVGTDDAVAA
jgi:hypothetical protein